MYHCELLLYEPVERIEPKYAGKQLRCKYIDRVLLADVNGFVRPGPALAVLVNAQSIGALVLGSLFAFPLTPWLMERLRIPRAEAPDPATPSRLATRSVHAIPIPLLAAGFVLSIAVLVGSTLNPFLYFRF